MKSRRFRQTLSLSLLSGFLFETALAVDESGFANIFDGSSMSGWETPDTSYWSVDEGAITGRITKEHPCGTNQYLVWQGGELADFELKMKSRVRGDGGINNGFQFKSRLLPDHDVCGYQVDNNLQTDWLVRLYDEFGRHTLAWRGERNEISHLGNRRVSKIVGSDGAAWFRLDEWHEYHLICVGPKITLYVDNRLAAEVTDMDYRRAEPQGILALQLHSGPPTVAQFKDIRLKVLKPAEVSPVRTFVQVRQSSIQLKSQALVWWDFDVAGHGAHPSIRHIPGWEKFEMNVLSDGPGARLGKTVGVLDGAYFDAGRVLLTHEKEFTLYLRLRDAVGKWDSTLISREGSSPATFCLRIHGTQEGTAQERKIAAEVATTQGQAEASFPIAQINPTSWHDIVIRYKATDLAIFCDGKLMAQQPVVGDLRSISSPLLIAAEESNGKVQKHFRGEIETVAIWNRALLETEIEEFSK